jgi:hypothetical protein
VDGKAEFYIEDSEYEDVQFVIKDTQNPGIASDATTVSFKAEDSAAPEVLRVEADTPWIVHIYFNENIDTTNAMNKSNYSGVGNIHTVCWYEDNVTLHLENRLDLGSTQSLTIKGFTSMGDITIKDSNNNYIPSDVTKSFTVPAVDYQGQAFPNSDWLEIQAAPTSVPPDSSQTVGITLYQKNACGYLTGSNAVNRTMDVGNVTITYAHDKNGSYSGPTLVSLSGGMVQFTITVDLEAGETMSITASGGGASSNVPAVVTAQGSS